MSDALNYLIAVRGDALGHYFKFLKDSGKHLDPKTRNLISVISKVHSQTEGGLKQYLTRALREGATPMEVIDALVMAFPMLEGPFQKIHPQVLGDVVISIETAYRDAKKEGMALEDEILFLLIHGILHLLGYDHEGSAVQARRMRDKERELFAALKSDVST